MSGRKFFNFTKYQDGIVHKYRNDRIEKSFAPANKRIEDRFWLYDCENDASYLRFSLRQDLFKLGKEDFDKI